MDRTKTFESLQIEQISLYRNDSFGVSLTNSKEENDNIKSIINENSSEKDVQGN